MQMVSKYSTFVCLRGAGSSASLCGQALARQKRPLSHRERCVDAPRGIRRGEQRPIYSTTAHDATGRDATRRDAAHGLLVPAKEPCSRSPLSRAGRKTSARIAYYHLRGAEVLSSLGGRTAFCVPPSGPGPSVGLFPCMGVRVKIPRFGVLRIGGASMRPVS